MGTAIAVRTDYSSKELRRLARWVKNAAQARRLLAMQPCLKAPCGKRQQRSAAWIVKRCGTG